jgi:hypothetical protein
MNSIKYKNSNNNNNNDRNEAQKNVNNTSNTHFTTTITGGSSIFAPGSNSNITFSTELVNLNNKL